jgi:hypothetical protein
LGRPQFYRYLEPEERMACQMITRLVLAGMNQELQAGQARERSARNWRRGRLVKLTDANP